jgi:tetratricopeptide (TPR) repeat protein
VYTVYTVWQACPPETGYTVYTCSAPQIRKNVNLAPAPWHGRLTPMQPAVRLGGRAAVVLLLLASCTRNAVAPPSPETLELYVEARALYAERRFDQALALLERNQAASPGFSGNSLLIGKIHFFREQYAQAQQVWERTLARNPHHLDTRKWLARLHLLRREPGPAYAVLSPGFADSAEDPELLILLGKTLRLLSRTGRNLSRPRPYRPSTGAARASRITPGRGQRAVGLDRASFDAPAPGRHEKGARAMRKMPFPAAIVILLTGCLLMETGRARELYVAPHLAGRIARATWVLDSVTVEQEFASRSVEADATYILRLLLSRRNERADLAGGTLLLRVRIKEREFAEDLRTRRTATVEIEAYPPPSSGETDPAAMALYSETTAQSVRSYAYLTGLLDRALRLLGQ